MGMHVGFIAARTSVESFRAAFPQVWPEFRVVDSEGAFADLNAMWEWKEAREKFVSAADATKDNRERQVFAFWQDGPWAVMLDESYNLAADEEKLEHLSRRVGVAMSFIVETTGGSAFFWHFENGNLRRMIANADGDVALDGDPLPEEAGINVDAYYMDESEALWKAFGLSPYEGMPRGEGLIAICVEECAEDDRPGEMHKIERGENNVGVDGAAPVPAGSGVPVVADQIDLPAPAVTHDAEAEPAPVQSHVNRIEVEHAVVEKSEPIADSNGKSPPADAGSAPSRRSAVIPSPSAPVPKKPWWKFW